MKLIGNYKNGNYEVSIFDDGTKIRATKDDEFKPEFPESFDCKICNRCNMNCPQCHEKSTANGDLGKYLNAKFLDTLHPYTEIAIGGGNPLEEPQLVNFLKRLRERKVIPNMTVHQKHFMEYKSFIKSLVDNKLIFGLGVSLYDATDEFIDEVKKFPNAVIHAINGLVKEDQMAKMSNQNLKILILGYKEFGRGSSYYSNKSEDIEQRKKYLSDNILELIPKFKACSFDNLALKQLELEDKLPQKVWENFYMGDDGNFTMYVDLVKGEFAKSSTSIERYPLCDTISEMFKKIYKENKNGKV